MGVEHFSKNIIDLWQFLTAPIITIGFAFIIIDVIVGPSFRACSIGTISELSRWLREQKELFSIYGVDKLLPITVGLIAVSILYMALEFMLFIGQLLPPYLHYRPDHLFLSIASQAELANIWSHFPGARDFDNVANILQFGFPMTREETDYLSGYKSTFGVDVGEPDAQFAAVKFFAMLAVCSALVSISLNLRGRMTTLLRLCGVIGILGFAGAYLGARYYDAISQRAYDQLLGTQTILMMRNSRNVEPQAEQYEARVADAKRLVTGKWWQITFLDALDSFMFGNVDGSPEPEATRAPPEAVIKKQ